MAINAGEEFNIRATPGQEHLRKLTHLAAHDTDSVFTGGVKSPRSLAGSAQSRKDGQILDTVQLLTLEEWRRQEQMQLLAHRLDRLDRASEQALREARERLDEIRRTANRTEDGRLAFEAEDGTVYDEHGNEVSPDEVDWEDWNPEGPTRSEFREALGRYNEAEDYRRQVMETKERLGDDPSEDELAALDEQVAELERTMPGRAAVEHEPAASARFTSAAKGYAGDAPWRDGAALQQPFSRAVVPADTDAAPEAEPTVTPEPGPAGPGG